MNTSFNRSLPTVMLPQSIVGAGKRAHELKPFEIGVFDCDTGLSVDVASFAPDKTYEIVYKSPSKGMSNSMFPDQFGTKLPIRSLPINLIDKVHVFDSASDVQQPFVAYLGYDGLSDCKNLDLTCGEDYALDITVRSEVVRNTFNRNLSQLVPFTLPCCEDCTAETKAETIADAIIEAIQDGPFYTKNYFKAEKVLSCCPVLAPFDKIYFKTYQLEVCDDGSSRAMASVQAQYPTADVFRVKRDNPYSTYEVCIENPFSEEDQALVDADKALLDAETPGTNDYDAALATWEATVATAITNATIANAPADFTMTNVKALECDECPDCPAGFTKVPAGFKYVVSVLNEDNTDDWVGNTEALAVALSIPDYVVNSAQFIASEGSTVTIQVVTSVAIPDPTTIANLQWVSLGQTAGYCSGSSTVEWCAKDDKYKIERTMCMIIADDECGNDFLAEIQAELGDVENVNLDSIAITSTNNCITEYTVTQRNNACLEDGCDTYGKDGAKFDKLPTFKTATWTMCACEGWTVDGDGCPVAPVTTTEDCRAGVKFTGGLIDSEILECTFAIDDNIEREPITLEISLVPNSNNPDVNTLCAPINIDWTVVQEGRTVQGDGRYVNRDEVVSRGYELYSYYNPKEELGNLMSQRSGFEYTARPDKFYNHLTLFHNSNRNRVHNSTSHTRECIKIFVEKDNVTFMEELKDFFNKTLLSQGSVKLL